MLLSDLLFVFRISLNLLLGKLEALGLRLLGNLRFPRLVGFLRLDGVQLRLELVVLGLLGVQLLLELLNPLVALLSFPKLLVKFLDEVLVLGFQRVQIHAVDFLGFEDRNGRRRLAHKIERDPTNDFLDDLATLGPARRGSDAMRETKCRRLVLRRPKNGLRQRVMRVIVPVAVVGSAFLADVANHAVAVINGRRFAFFGVTQVHREALIYLLELRIGAVAVAAPVSVPRAVKELDAPQDALVGIRRNRLGQKKSLFRDHFWLAHIYILRYTAPTGRPTDGIFFTSILTTT